MNASSQPPRTPTQLSDSVHHQLSMYALAASAAGVGVLSLAQLAEAKIVDTRTSLTIGPNQNYVIDLNHDGIGDFTISNFYGCSDLCAAVVEVSPAKGNVAAGNNFHYALALTNGAVIGPKQFAFSGQVMAYCCEFPTGSWFDVTNRYLGLKFQIKGKTHYGWARLSVFTTQSFTFAAALTGYAYETVPNKPIIAGKTKGPDVITVQPATLGTLALGRK
jgi:hypothetical protein